MKSNNPLVYVDVRSYGAVGDGVTDDQPAIQMALNAAINSGRGLYLPAGNYRLAKNGATQISADLNHNLVVRGDGPDKTRLLRADGVITKNFQPIIRVRNATGRVVSVRFENFSVDGNARGNPMPANLEPQAWQHTHAIFVNARSLNGFENASFSDLSFFDLTADGISIGGNASRGTRNIFCERITASGRTRTRSDITVTGTYDSFTVLNSTLEKLETELNGANEVSTGETIIKGTIVSVKLDLNYKEYATPLTVKDCVFTGNVNLIGYKSTFSNCRFDFGDGERLRMVGNAQKHKKTYRQGELSVKFQDCNFRVDYRKKSLSPIYTHNRHTNHAQLRFVNCKFTSVGRLINTYFADANKLSLPKITSFQDCEFSGDMRYAITIGAGVLNVADCLFNLKNGAEAAINLLEVKVDNIKTEAELLRNRSEGEGKLTLVRFPGKNVTSGVRGGRKIVVQQNTGF